MHSLSVLSALLFSSLPFLATAAPASEAPTRYTKILSCADEVALTTKCMAGSYPMNMGCDMKADSGSMCSTWVFHLELWSWGVARADLGACRCECISDNGFWQSQLNQYASRVRELPSSWLARNLEHVCSSAALPVQVYFDIFIALAYANSLTRSTTAASPISYKARGAQCSPGYGTTTGAAAPRGGGWPHCLVKLLVLRPSLPLYSRSLSSFPCLPHSHHGSD